METLNGGIFHLHSPHWPSSCQPGIISLLGLWIANTGYRKTNHQGWALHLVTLGSLVCDRCNKTPWHSAWQEATWSSWHHDRSQDTFTWDFMWQQWVSHTLIENRSPPVKFVVWDSLGEKCAPEWSEIVSSPPPPTELLRHWLKIKSWRPAADLFVFPKLYLLHGKQFFSIRLNICESRAPSGPQQINSEWNSSFINSTLSTQSYSSILSELAVWELTLCLVVASHCFISLP